MRSVRTVAGAIALTVIGALALTGCGGGDDHPAKQTHSPRPSATVSAKPTALTVGFYGSADEIAAYKQAVDNYDAAQQSVTLTLETWPSAAAMMSDLTAGKPAPDVFLHAAASMGVEPTHCVVVEDTASGITAAVAASMRVLGYAADSDEQALRDAGATAILRSLYELPQLLSLG